MNFSKDQINTLRRFIFQQFKKTAELHDYDFDQDLLLRALETKGFRYSYEKEKDDKNWVCIEILQIDIVHFFGASSKIVSTLDQTFWNTAKKRIPFWNSVQVKIPEEVALKSLTLEYMP